MMNVLIMISPKSCLEEMWFRMSMDKSGFVKIPILIMSFAMQSIMITSLLSFLWQAS